MNCWTYGKKDNVPDKFTVNMLVLIGNLSPNFYILLLYVMCVFPNWFTCTGVYLLHYECKISDTFW
jgi:hypothetical protein